jgi:hypothetical protein
LGDAVAPEDDGREASCHDGEKKHSGYGVFHGAVLSTKDASRHPQRACPLIGAAIGPLPAPEDRRARLILSALGMSNNYDRGIDREIPGVRTTAMSGLSGLRSTPQ